MFTVEWIKSGTVILEEPTIAVSIDDIEQGLPKRTAEVVEKTGQMPDEIRVFDHLRNESVRFSVAAGENLDSA